MDAQEFDELMKEPFRVPDLTQVWRQILDLYRDFGFELPLLDAQCQRLSDEDMIKEFQWVYGQYRKFIGTHRAPWLSLQYDLDSLLFKIKEAIEKESKTPVSRAEVIYQAMRNAWLQDLWNHVAWVKENKDEEGKDE